MKFIKLSALCVLLAIQFDALAQSLPVGTAALEDYYRRAQLLAVTDTNVSFTVRPIFPNSIDKKIDPFFLDTLAKKNAELRANNLWQINTKDLNVNFLPLSFQTQFNSDHPYGWNDGPMIPAKGLQGVISAGVFFRYGPLSIQLKPEFVYAANNNFSTFNPTQYDVVFARYYDIYNNIDLPAKFGNGSYSKAYWGQSSIRLNYKSLSFGISSENLWWGPGIRNSLLMSNTAPGFLHLTLNTTKPIKTAIGSFEGQLIGGRLENSGFPPLEPDHYFFTTNLYVPKANDWRYLAGVVVTWQPKWVPGLFLGFDQSSVMYGKDLGGIKDYLPLFSPIKQSQGVDNPINQKDQVNSVFMRWLWTKEHAEIYFEYGHYDNNNDLLQSLLDPGRSRAYIFGIRKLYPFNTVRNENIMIGVEVTQLQENSISDIIDGKSWYLGHNVRQGYTNNGEVLGAGIGPGGNMQSLDVSWVKGLKKIGVQFERYVHNNDAYYYIFENSQNYSEHWVDLSIAATGEWDYKNLIFNAKIQGIQSLDYQWALKQNGNDPGFANQLGKFNLQIQMGISYRF